MRLFIKFLVRKIPRNVLIRFSPVLSIVFSFIYKGNKVKCPVCESSFSKFLPYGNIGAVNRLCPKCLSLERHRLLWLYFINKTNLFKSNLKVLHIAPEQAFYKRFRKLKNLDYITADLLSPLADIKMDIQNIPLEDNTFDVIICNHVLEHVEDEFKAVSELFRVLKKGGWAILQVPIDYKRSETYEDKTITSPKEREKHFGQYDHVRFHGLDYPERLRKSGFKVSEDNYISQFDDKTVEYFRLPKQEIIYLCTKE